MNIIGSIKTFFNGTVGTVASTQSIPSTLTTTLTTTTTTTTAGTTGSGYIATIPANITTTMPPSHSISATYAPLTDSELKELEELQRNHKEKCKLEKLNIFKRLPTDLRQHVVNMILWSEAVSAMESAPEPSKSDRFNELEIRKNYHPYYFMGGGMTAVNVSPSFYGNPLHIQPQLPDNISSDDLKKAHMEATLEEQMLGSDDV